MAVVKVAGNKRVDADHWLSKQTLALALRLKVVYGTALAVELALRQQDAERDVDLADCLRGGVCGPIFDLAQHIQGILMRLGGEIPEPLP